MTECIPNAIASEEIELGMDFHDEPFYRKQEDTRKLTCSGQAKKGTTHFVRIATADMIWRQVRLTLTVRYVLPKEDSLETIKILWKCLKTLGYGTPHGSLLKSSVEFLKILKILCLT